MDSESPEEIKKRVKRMWDYLHSEGIYDEKQLNEALKKLKLDIGIFVSPVKITKEDMLKYSKQIK